MDTMTPDAIRKLDEQIEQLKAERAKLRLELERETVQDYELRRLDGSAVRLSELFGDQSELIVVHNMGAGCNYCSLWADVFISLYPHLRERAAFVLVSNDEPSKAKAHAERRGWIYPVVSGRDSDFTRDMGFSSTEYGSMPGASAFKRQDDGTIVRTAHTFFGPGDDYCPVWPFFELLEGGAKGWEPRH